jgi:primosomal protein N' (replication factor Y)
MSTFHNKKAQILLGTQMIAKGLDFEDVEFCGIILSDIGLHLPDFRAEERVFQLLIQVSGRAGRRNRQGEILIQTYNPDEKIYKFVKNHQVEEFILWQKEIRKEMNLPPFGHVLKFTFSNMDKSKAFFAAKKFEKYCKTFESKEMSIEVNFAPAFFPKMYNKYNFHIFIKGAKNEIKNLLKKLEIPEDVKADKYPMTLL